MIRYKLLLTGKNKTVIDDFFSHLNDEIETLSTSQRWDDIMNHLKYYEADAFCYCASNELIENMKQTISLKERLEKDNIPFVFIGSEEDWVEFDKEAHGVADLVLKKPLKASKIEGMLLKYIDELREIEEQKRKEEEQRRLEEERKRQEEEIERMQEEEQRQTEEDIRRAKLEKMQRLKEQQAIDARKGQKRHVMIVDDDSTMLRAIKEQLHEKYDVATALSGKIALKFLEKKTTDLILLDYEMPGENGPMILEKLRSNPATKNIPVIFLTGVTESNKVTQVLAMKPQGYLLKPIDHEKLLMAIEKVMIGEKYNA